MYFKLVFSTEYVIMTINKSLSEDSLYIILKKEMEKAFVKCATSKQMYILTVYMQSILK